MPDRTYVELQKQIAELKAQALEVRALESAKALAKIKELIGMFELSPADVFGPRFALAKPMAKSAGRPVFGDGKGNTWTGRGPRPQWLRDVIAGGKSIDDFRLGSGAGSVSVKQSTSALNGAKRNAPVTAKPMAAQKRTAKHYSDGINTWSGFGPKPRWLREAIEGGKKLEDFQI